MIARPIFSCLMQGLVPYRFQGIVKEHKEQFKAAENSANEKNIFHVKAVKIGLVQAPVAIDARQERQG
jgi:hypothetical protein